ncbi:hypothetical protein DXF93_23550 [Escherichia coli]|nr:hypothetical protein C2U51_04010 [Enterobacteriaceae bacterium ENNIH1]RDT52021.1 hypothetical protein DXF93_23550 [Escherichia coli]
MLIQPVLLIRSPWSYIVLGLPLRQSLLRNVLLFISIRDRVTLCHFPAAISLHIGYGGWSRDNLSLTVKKGR